MRRGLYGAIGFTGAFLLFAGVGVASAQDVEFAGNVSLVSDYAFRGISQTLEEPAVQGGIDASLPSGLYAGVWGSSVNFGEDLADGARAQMELDLYGGIAPSVAGFDLDVGALYYMYPGAASSRNYDYLEVLASISRVLGPLSVGVSGAWSPDFFAASGTGLYGGVDVSVGVPSTPITLDGSVGRQTIETNTLFGTPDYTTWSAGASAEFMGLGIGAGVTGTNLDDSECFGGSSLCDTRVILSVGI